MQTLGGSDDGAGDWETRIEFPALQVQPWLLRVLQERISRWKSARSLIIEKKTLFFSLKTGQ